MWSYWRPTASDANPAMRWLFFPALALAAELTRADPGCTPSPFQVYWNNYGPVFQFADLSQWLITSGNVTQTGNDCGQPGCTAWTQGLWPTIDNNGKPVNGGVPQAANLSAHLAALEETIVGWLPDPLWDGNAVFDFENWCVLT